MSPRQKVLIVDDDPGVREYLEISLGRMQRHTRSARTLGEARHWLARESFDLCLSDLHLPDGTGLELLEHIQRRRLRMPLAILSACARQETAVQALKAGAIDFLSKPVALARLRELLNSALPGSTPAPPATGPLLGDSAAMHKLRGQIDKLAQSQASVYISGESGSGKELVARAIHDQGPRANRAFVPVNCGAIPPELMESEFFGHRKGSFSGAIEDKPGLFQAAHGGTLFLDEVADLPLAMQVKLLRALQEKAVRCVGGQQEVQVDARILCATHKALQAEVRAGRFRQDLYYRLNVIELPVPPLRARKDDIEPLATAILERLAQGDGQPLARLQPSALLALQGYDFPGNVRELENLLERAHTLCENRRIEARDLRLTSHSAHPAIAPGAAQVIDLEDHLQEIERRLILQALEHTRWNRTAAAQRLSLSFRSMRYRLKKLGLD
ncbi:sigma-54-dependent transcriptional regulator [Pseudomonas chlororaphis]|uniref:sigma-54-dependent transcriptional regulator n=1 Tax=Pseudomonas chlororaphis TaxID=587753 RepID=UPI000F560120|nr:sigma-54 dependent transcriptional regulator [Pseudomonas chlororaphis]MBP5059635.1 sigma-54-dependent Fis family transcriptional regulator [Pseudomonas chlororaphis]MBP5139216.1 sigma-54-dependent Fis family transcriptional regulator [Pseudomonas chlororaphis]QTT84719.1 sigma-54-dependent Fis family transcriptional regulator [Pseudomonas chlororaphis]QTU01552.1 sigma-54-dependent Fis family transcriptional regulator [Pseudomonas chlororaphis]